MIFRPLRVSDLPLIDYMHRHYYPDHFLPNRNNIIVDGTVDRGGKVVGYGMIKLFAEPILLLDRSASKIERGKAFKLVMDVAIRAAKSAAIEQINVFSDDDAFLEVMKKHYGFKPRLGNGIILEV